MKRVTLTVTGMQDIRTQAQVWHALDELSGVLACDIEPPYARVHAGDKLDNAALLAAVGSVGCSANMTAEQFE